MKIGFVGLGNMAKAMISGIIGSGIAKAEEIYGSSRTKETLEKVVGEYGINGCTDNGQVVVNADVVIFAVKPQMYENVIKTVAEFITEDKLVVSIAPGKTLKWLSDLIPGKAKIVRCMPNTPALVGEGCTGVCRNEYVNTEDFSKVMCVLESFGKAYEVQEYMMDAVVAVSGSSPAYIFMLIEAMADGAVMSGLPRSEAYKFAAQSVLGSAKLMLETGKHPAELKDMVCSPAGTTIEAVKVLEEKGFRAAIIAAEKACADKSKGI